MRKRYKVRYSPSRKPDYRYMPWLLEIRYGSDSEPFTLRFSTEEKAQEAAIGETSTNEAGD